MALAAIFFTMILVNNYVLVQFLGICPFLGVSKKLDSACGMSCAVIFVMALATAVTWPIQNFLLTPVDAEGNLKWRSEERRVGKSVDLGGLRIIKKIKINF